MDVSHETPDVTTKPLSQKCFDLTDILARSPGAGPRLRPCGSTRTGTCGPRASKCRSRDFPSVGSRTRGVASRARNAVLPIRCPFKLNILRGLSHPPPSRLPGGPARREHEGGARLPRPLGRVPQCGGPPSRSTLCALLCLLTHRFMFH